MSRWFFALVLLPTFLVSTHAQAHQFPDIVGHWAEHAVTKAVYEGWVNGYPDGTFRPDDSVSRAEYVKMLLAAQGLFPGSSLAEKLARSVDYTYCVTESDSGLPRLVACLHTSSPPDVSDVAEHWIGTQGWLAVALNLGVVHAADYEGGGFCPDDPITRHEAVTMVVRALGRVYPASHTEGRLPFVDADQVPDWASGSIMEAVNAGIIRGYPDNTLRPNGTISRAEAVTLVLRMLSLTDEGKNPAIKVYVSREEYGPEGRKVRWEPVVLPVPVHVVNGVPLVPAAAVYEAKSGLAMKWNPSHQILGLWGYAGDVHPGALVYQAGRPKWGLSTVELSLPPRLVRGVLLVPLDGFFVFRCFPLVPECLGTPSYRPPEYKPETGEIFIDLEGPMLGQHPVS